MPRNDRDDETESRRILDRLRRESETEAGFLNRAWPKRAGRDAKKPVDDEDWPEVWGTRIGRTLGFIFVMFLIAWLVSFLMRGG